MATSPAEDIHTQLAGLLGKRSTDIMHIRMTHEDPPAISVIDVVQVITGMAKNNAGNYFERMKTTHPEVSTNCRNYRFPGRGQRLTPVMADTRSIVELILALPGRHAARVRRQAAKLLVRYLGGDLSLVDEVCALRGLQEELAVRAPQDPARAFGEAVEAAPPAEYLSRVCTDIVGRTVPLMLDKLSSYIDERLAHVGTRQVVNLNVRAPKRPAPHLPQVANDIAGAGRPFPIAKFLDQKEREDPTWSSARKSFAPAFGMLTQVLKKKKLRDEGRRGTYVVQNHRAQMLYTEEDRELMEQAWELAAAHREDLAGRCEPPAPAVQDRASVIALLQRASEVS